MKFLKSLPARLMLAIAVGMIAGFFLPEGAMQVVVLLAILTHTLNLFILLYFVLNFGMTALSLKRMLNE